jgi:hypothetical protein
MRALPTQDQLEQIVKARLASIDAFDSDAITWYALRPSEHCEESVLMIADDRVRAQVCVKDRCREWRCTKSSADLSVRARCLILTTALRSPEVA